MQALHVIDAVGERRPDTSTLLPLEQYDFIISCVSGGKDSLATSLDLFDRGVPRHKIEWWHHHVDGAPGTSGLMDWPITEDYCRKVAKAFDMPIYFQYRMGGFEREMLRNNQATAPVRFEMPGGKFGQAGGTSGKLNTRCKFPQKSANLSVRWCSASLKIDVCSIAINNDPRFKKAKVLVITGERREESTARSRYATVERHRTTNRRRRTDQWRSILEWSESDVWDIIRRYKVNPHPAYHLGWGRVSCMCCIFGDRSQWASVRQLAPERFDKILGYEKQFGVTIDRRLNVAQLADLGESFIDDAPAELKRLAMAKEYDAPVFIEDWQLPKGAYKRCGGPT